MSPHNLKYILFSFLVAIEYNGEQHYKYIPYFHKGGTIDFEKQQKRDLEVEEYCKSVGISLLQIKFSDDVKTILENWKLEILLMDT